MQGFADAEGGESLADALIGSNASDGCTSGRASTSASMEFCEEGTNQPVANAAEAAIMPLLDLLSNLCSGTSTSSNHSSEDMSCPGKGECVEAGNACAAGRLCQPSKGVSSMQRRSNQLQQAAANTSRALAGVDSTRAGEVRSVALQSLGHLRPNMVSKQSRHAHAIGGQATAPG